MNKQDIVKEIDRIRACSNDYEMAHGIEDSLDNAFIQFVALRDDELGDMARLVLTTADIDFSRHCA